MIQVDYFIDWSWGLLIATGVILILLIIELRFISKSYHEEVGKCCFDLVLFVRRFLSLALVSLWSYGCYLIYNFDEEEGVEGLKALVSNECTNDVVLRETFKSMHAYVENTQD